MKLFDHELKIVNINHIACTASYSRGIYNKLPRFMLSAFLRRMTHSLNGNIPCVSVTGNNKDITYVKPQSPIIQPGEGRLFDAPFRGSFHLQNALYKVRGLAAETGRDDITTQGISLNPSRLGCLIYSALAKVIPYCYL